MPGTGNYTGVNVNSDYIFDVGTALYQLRDNTTELIDPKDIRDSIWTLWNRVDDVQITASQSIATPTTFTNPLATTVTVGGITAGTTFAGTYSLQQMLDLMLYPYQSPILSLSINNTPRQYGSGLAATLTWGVTKKSNTITGISVNGTTIATTGTTQNGTLAVTATHSLSFNTLTNESQTFTMSVTDNKPATISTTTTLNWRHKIYWGNVNLSGAGNPNLTNHPLEAPSVAAICTDVVVRSLSGASISPGYALATSYVRNYNGINGAGLYLIFAHPTSFYTAAGRDPIFKVNGLPNTAFTKVRSNSPLVTDTGITVNYDVWVSNTAQNSSIDIFEVS